MIYLDVIVTDEVDSIEIIGTKDHKWMGLKDVLKKPKVSLWHLYKLKKFLETSYERLNKDSETPEVQTDPNDSGEEFGIKRTDTPPSVTEPEPRVEQDKR